MAHTVSDYYGGSRIFIGISDYLNISVDQVNFVLCQTSALLLASLYRTKLHSKRVAANIRHAFGLIFAIAIGFFCFGSQAIHLGGLSFLCFLALKTQRTNVAHKVVLAIALLYLSCIHMHRQFYDYGSYSLDITGPLMVITQKVTSLAFHLYDGSKSPTELTKSQQMYAVQRAPTALEYFSFSLHFPSLLAGPVIFYKDYMDFIEGNNDTPPSGTEASSLFYTVCRKLMVASAFVIIFVRFQPVFPIEHVKSKQFLDGTSIGYKFWYLYCCTTLTRFKYYFAWMLADAICNNAGMGYNSKAQRWDQISNVDIVKFEMGTSLRECIEAWNVGTNRWLRMIVYDRTKRYPTIFTYLLSALWHGFYPGYYMTFANGALFTVASRIMRRSIRQYFTDNADLKLLYDSVTFVTTKLVMIYITFTFILLEFSPGIHIYMSLYWCLHIGALLAILAVPKCIIQKPTKEAVDKSLLKQAFYQSKPLTNGVSRHYD